jgi:hypothetical protein
MRRSAARRDHTRQTDQTDTDVQGDRRPKKTGGRAALRRLSRRILPAVVLLCSLTAVAAVAAGGAAAATSQNADTPSKQAERMAEADPQVATVLAGTDWVVEAVPWGGTAERPAGVTVTYRWPATQRRSVAASWPLLKSMDGDQPTPPYATVDHRLRIADLTGLQVDVLFEDSRVLQLLPVDGETPFRLYEETWPPFSWIPRFTAHPWVLVPVFAVVGLIIIARSWRRSRAWNRRLPSMTRHDRQFIGRLSVILFLLAGLSWQIYEAVVAASAPSVDPGGFHAGDLAALPLLLFPPALFFAALALEFTPGSHRASWGLVAALCAVGSVYNLATAMTGTSSNLNLSYYILLAVLALLAAPRAFSAGRMGWSRQGVSRYA